MCWRQTSRERDAQETGLRPFSTFWGPLGGKNTHKHRRHRTRPVPAPLRLQFAPGRPIKASNTLRALYIDLPFSNMTYRPHRASPGIAARAQHARRINSSTDSASSPRSRCLSRPTPTPSSAF